MFNNRNKFGGGRDGGRSGGRRFGGHGDSDRPTMHKAVCDECGQNCEVPFRPSGDKPVLCHDCFKGNGRDGGSRNSGRGDFQERRFSDRDEERKMYKATCDDCGEQCEVPFKPSHDKPVFCNDCFGGGKGEKRDGKNDQALMQKLDALDAKLDRIINLLAPAIIVDGNEEKVVENEKTEQEKALDDFLEETPKKKKRTTKKVLELEDL